MPRKKTPSFVLTLPLATVPADERRLDGTLEAAKRLHNVILQNGLDIVDAVRADPAWTLARKLPRSTKEQRVARGEAFGAVRAAHGFSEFRFHELMKVHRNASGLNDRVGAHPAQKLATKLFQALEQYLLGKRGRPRFKGVKRPLHSIEGRKTGLTTPRSWKLPGSCWSPPCGLASCSFRTRACARGGSASALRATRA